MGAIAGCTFICGNTTGILEGEFVGSGGQRQLHPSAVAQWWGLLIVVWPPVHKLLFQILFIG